MCSMLFFICEHVSDIANMHWYVWEELNQRRLKMKKCTESLQKPPGHLYCLTNLSNLQFQQSIGAPFPPLDGWKGEGSEGRNVLLPIENFKSGSSDSVTGCGKGTKLHCISCYAMNPKGGSHSLMPDSRKQEFSQRKPRVPLEI